VLRRHVKVLLHEFSNSALEWLKLSAAHFGCCSPEKGAHDTEGSTWETESVKLDYLGEQQIPILCLKANPGLPDTTIHYINMSYNGFLYSIYVDLIQCTQSEIRVYLYLYLKCNGDSKLIVITVLLVFSLNILSTSAYVTLYAVVMYVNIL
jgi:hypothetical protein